MKINNNNKKKIFFVSKYLKKKTKNVSIKVFWIKFQFSALFVHSRVCVLLFLGLDFFLNPLEFNNEKEEEEIFFFSKSDFTFLF